MAEERKRETLGERLKKVRTERGLSLEEVSKKTRIHIRVLNAIEEDRIESLTNPFYAKSFVKSYAQLLGIEQDELVRQFLSGAKRPAKQVLFLEGEKERERLEVLKIAKVVFIALLAAILLLYSFSIVRSFVKKHKAIKTKTVSSKVAKPAKPALSKVEKLALGKVEKPKPEKEEGLSLTISAKEDCWLQLKRDGRIIFKGVLAKNKKESWKAKDKFELWVGNAGALEFNLNGKDLGSPGKKGEIIKNITLTKEGMKIK